MLNNIDELLKRRIEFKYSDIFIVLFVIFLSLILLVAGISVGFAVAYYIYKNRTVLSTQVSAADSLPSDIALNSSFSTQNYSSIGSKAIEVSKEFIVKPEIEPRIIQISAVMALNITNTSNPKKTISGLPWCTAELVVNNVNCEYSREGVKKSDIAFPQACSKD